MECLMNELPPFFIFILWHLRMTVNDGMKRNEGDFGSNQEINSEIPLCSHSVISTSFRNELVPIILSDKSLNEE